jgi:hypothetical protein
MEFQAYVASKKPSSRLLCGKPVHGSSISCGSTAYEDFFYGQGLGNFAGDLLRTRLRERLRLIATSVYVKFVAPKHDQHPTAAVQTVPSTAVHQFRELIAGQPYLIEVTAVATGRWRAYIVRLPGVPTALMPFYGPTPDEAAGQLRQWLTDAHERAAKVPCKV